MSQELDRAVGGPVTPGNCFQPRGPVPCGPTTQAMRALPLSRWRPGGTESAGSGQAPCSAPLLSVSHTCLDLRRPPWKCAECEPAHRPLAATDEVAVTPRCSGPQPQVPGAMSPRPQTTLPVFTPAWPCPHQGILLLSGALAPETCLPGNVVETWAQDRRPHPLA